MTTSIELRVGTTLFDSFRCGSLRERHTLVSRRAGRPHFRAISLDEMDLGTPARVRKTDRDDEAGKTRHPDPKSTQRRAAGASAAI